MERRPNSGPDTPCWYVGMDRGTLPLVPAVHGFDHLTRPGPTQIAALRRLAQRDSSIRVYTYASVLLKTALIRYYTLT